MPVYLQEDDALAEAPLNQWAYHPALVDTKKHGLGVTANFTDGTATAAAGAAAVAFANRLYHAEFSTQQTESLAAPSGDNYVYLQWTDGTQDSETLVVSDTEGLPDDPKLLLAYVDGNAEAVEQRNEFEAFATQTALDGKADDPHDNAAHSTAYAEAAALTALDTEYETHTHDGQNGEPSNLEPDSVSNQDYNESVETHATASGTVDIDLSVANVHVIEAVDNVTITFSNVTSTPPGNSLLLKFSDDDAGGPYTITWPASVIWDNGTERGEIPASSNIRISLETSDGGTEWWAIRSGDDFA